MNKTSAKVFSFDIVKLIEPTFLDKLNRVIAKIFKFVFKFLLVSFLMCFPGIAINLLSGSEETLLYSCSVSFVATISIFFGAVVTVIILYDPKPIH